MLFRSRQESDSEMHEVDGETLKERILKYHKKLKQHDMVALGAIRSSLVELQVKKKEKRMPVYWYPHKTELQRRQMEASEVQLRMVPEVGDIFGRSW